MADLLVVFGTRPEAIKLGPVVAELRTLGVDTRIVCTGQHTTLLQGTPAESDLAGGLSLGLASDGSVARWMTKAQNQLIAFTNLSPAINGTRPAAVVVQGDVMSAHVGAVAAQLCDVPVAHVEAGVRSHDLNDPWPEEQNRVSITRIASLHLAPTSTAFANLVAEGVAPNTIRVTGNTVVSALARYAPGVRATNPPDNLVLVTLHRREIQRADRLGALLQAIADEARARPATTVLWPVHPACAKYLNRALAPRNLVLENPLTYEPFVRTLARTKLVITDSGGLVEEAATLGVPTVILRMTNDRPEAVDAEMAYRLDPTPDGVRAAFRVADDVSQFPIPREPTSVFGDPGAAGIVARELARLANDA